METAIQEYRAEKPTSVWTREQIELINRTIAVGATDDELKLFLHTAQRLGLDPFARQIHFIKRKRKNPQTGQYEEYGQTLVGIDGFRAIAERTGKLAGIKRGVIRDEKGNLIGAWAEVHRSDWREPVREEVLFVEYCQRDASGKPTGLWATMPSQQLKKCAEAMALRMAFPMVLSGIYAPEEMEQSYAPEHNGAVEPEVVPPETNKNVNGSGAEKASEKQRKMIFALAKKQNITHEDLKAIILAHYGTEHTSELTKDQASQLIDKLEHGEVEIPVPSFDDTPEIPYDQEPPGA